jgi:photosystem II stability/assembly factor-like uncharacterized protein
MGLSLLFCLMWVANYSQPLSAQEWQPMGPPGGDVRALAADPANPHIFYLGTTDGHIFGTQDDGEHWRILGRAGIRQDGVVTGLIVDSRESRTLYASTWTRGAGKEGGGVFRSVDGGRNWTSTGLSGHAVRALAQSISDPDLLVAGALDGVFRSSDSGKTWDRISPEGDEELRNFDSIAIDPVHPQIIYAGTFHLPWKTSDGGRNWVSIHNGMIDDSDVLSVVVDRAHPLRLFASACSGIYRSDSAGTLWKKIQGIPYSARRTYVIRQDPSHLNTVYAGTSEGLWKSADAGATWRRVSPADWVINALAFGTMASNAATADAQGEPAELVRHQRLLIGTDQLGVLSSDDGGAHFHGANSGFSHRQIVALALDQEHRGRVLAVLANAPEPALATDDNGQTWAPLGPGLRAEGLKRAYASPAGWLAALERGGLKRYDSVNGNWTRLGSVVGEAAVTIDPRGRRIPSSKPLAFNLIVNDMAFSKGIWFAATPNGLLASRDLGATWSLFSFAPLVLPVSSVRVSADGQQLRVVSLRGMVFSQDAGKTWSWHDLPVDAGGVSRLDVADEDTLLASSQHGLYVSRDAGKSWQVMASGLPQVPIQDLAFAGRVWVASVQTGGLYISTDRGATWGRIEGTLAEGYFPAVTTGQEFGIVYAASTTDGLYAVEVASHPATAATAASTSQR